MSQEDDLRGLAKVMDFMRALSVLFVVVNIYWFCYPSIREWNVNIGVVDRILLNFQRTTGLFGSILWTKLFSVTFLALSCLGTKGVKEEKIKWVHIWTALCAGVVLFFFTGGCSACPYRYWHAPPFIYSLLPSATSACSLPVYGSPACSNRISWTMCSTTRTKVSCRKQGLSKMNIP